MGIRPLMIFGNTYPMIDFDTDIYYYDKAAANKVIRFIEKYITHVKGDFAGESLILENWQKEDIIKPAFGIKKKKDGSRRFKIIYVEVPKGNAKSTLGAALMLYVLGADGQKGGEVYSAAGDRDQATIIFDIAKDMISGNINLSARFKIWKYSITYPKTNGKYKAISAEAGTKHGYNPSGIAFDELHVQPNKELWDTLVQGAIKRANCIIFAFTTAGYDMETICYEQHDYAIKVRDGVIKDDSFLPVVYAAEPEDDIYDIAIWKKANPGFGTIVQEDFFHREILKIKHQPSHESTFRRLHLNQWVGSAETWIPDNVWMKNSAEPIYKGKCYGGVDLSTVGDISAYVLFWPDTKAVKCYLFVPGDCVDDRSRREGINYDVWVKDKLLTATPGNTIDYSYIMKAMIDSREKYEVAAIGFDRYLMEDLGNKFSQADVDLEKWPLLPIGQGYVSMSEPTKTIERMAYSGELRHGGNPVLRWMCSNIQIESDAAGNIKMSKKKSREKIDGMVALAMAISAWGGAEPEFRSRYEDEGAELDSINM